MNDLDWNLIRSFVAVTRGGSLAAGARQLGVAHATVARHIQQLEQDLGMLLFTRSRQGLALNESGARLADAARAMHTKALAFGAASVAMREAPVGIVRVTASELLAECLPQLLVPDPQVARRHGLTVDIVVADSLLGLLEHEADIALRHVRPTQKELVCRRVGALSMGVYASDGYVAHHGSLDPDRYDQHRFIDSLSHDHLVRGAARVGFSIDRSQVAFRSDSLICRRAAMEAGWGIAALPVAMMADVPGCRSVFENERVADLEVWLATRPETRDNTSLKAVFDTLGESLRLRLNEANTPSVMRRAAHPEPNAGAGGPRAS